LGETFSYWKHLRTTLEDQHGPLTEEWKQYAGSAGWTMKLLRKKRNLFFFSPQKNAFQITFLFGDKAGETIAKSALPKKIISDLKNSQRYPEGRALRMTVKHRSILQHILTLTAIKLEK
jgi:hypothetical protein